MSKNAEILASTETEFTTTEVIRIKDEYFLRYRNGGTRGAWDNKQNNCSFNTAEISIGQARAKLLEMDLEPAEVDALTNRKASK